ncbi:helix-turn-helix domain-containing protein [Actinomycetospora corticicola]|uniref:AcrR family transcriptional regulator n=1 Tax=Actinomycetospora corticicola TaxID=663602 RepID=A0A7Y9J6Q7_9PSEU|nr:AcrR family transcriptional regulator [Actinomycetospora corticicola]
MPRNRRPRDREEKSAEIVEAAAALFAEVGFEKASMAAVARGAGVTTTTIYWYFQDKEALLVAVLDHLLVGMLEGLQAQVADSWTDRLLWVVERLQEHSKLVTAVHALSATSATVATWHSAFHELTDALLAAEIRDAGVDAAQVPAMARLGVFTIEGLLMHPLPREEQRAVLELLSVVR